MTDNQERDVHTAEQLVLRPHKPPKPDMLLDPVAHGWWDIFSESASAIQIPMATLDHHRDGHRQTRQSAARNARRLVAAWNACAGIETESLEKGADGWLAKVIVLGGDATGRADDAEALLGEAEKMIGWLLYLTTDVPGPHGTKHATAICRYCARYDRKHADDCEGSAFLAKLEARKP